MKSMNFIKKACAIVLCLAMCIPALGTFAFSASAAEAEGITTKDYLVKDDAWIRKDKNQGTPIADETLAAGHGGIYAFDENVKTIVTNVKKKGDNVDTRTLMKYDLPSAADIDQFDMFVLTFYVARIADPLNGSQTYGIYYDTDFVWSEAEVTWNQYSAECVDLAERKVDEFTTNKTVNSNQTFAVTVDVTELVTKLVKEQNKTSVTMIVAAENDLETTLQIHAKGSLGGQYMSRISGISGYDVDLLKALVSNCEMIITDGCDEAGVQAFEAAMESANNCIEAENVTAFEIKNAYEALDAAKDVLWSTKEYLLTQDCHIRSRNDKKGSVNNAKQIEIKNHNINEVNSLIGLMDIELPTLAEVEKNGFDSFEFQFDFAATFDGVGSFGFYFVDAIDYKETEATWNNTFSKLPTGINDTKVPLTPAFVYTSPQKVDYRTSTPSDVDTTVTFDVTDTVMSFINQGKTKVTIVANGIMDPKAHAALAIWSSEADDATKAPRLLAHTPAKKLTTTTETLELPEGQDYKMYSQTRAGKDGTTDYRIIVVAKEDYIKSLESATVTVTFTGEGGNKSVTAPIKQAFTSIEAVDFEGNITNYVAEDGLVIMGVVIVGVPAAYTAIDNGEFKPVSK